MESIGYCEYSLVGRLDQFLLQILNKDVVLKTNKLLVMVIPRWAYLSKPEELVINCSNRLLNGFFKRPSDTHDFPDTLHATAQDFAHSRELFEIPAWNLDYNIVERWLKARAGDFGH